MIYADVDAFHYCCGVDEVGMFIEDGFGGYQLDKISSSGTGLFISTFINNKPCKKAYKQLCKEHTLLYQSLPKRNAMSYNEVFVCVFLHGDVK